MPGAVAARREDQALVAPTDTPGYITARLGVTDSNDAHAGQDEDRAHERVSRALRRLEKRYYEQPAILDRIADVIWRALGSLS